MSETDKAIEDAMIAGLGIMKDGKRVAPDEFYKGETPRTDLKPSDLIKYAIEQAGGHPTVHAHVGALHVCTQQAIGECLVVKRTLLNAIERVEQMEDALAFYADRGNWLFDNLQYHPECEVLKDKGQRAREVLKK